MNITIRNTQDIQHLVRSHRQHLGLTQAELAAKAGVSLRWLAGLEAGQGGTSIDKILATLDVLGLSIRAQDKSASALSDVIAGHRS